MMSGSDLICARGLDKAFGRTRALVDVAFTTGPGVTGLLGPNGAGKTTLMRILATVLAPDAGSVELLGLDPRVASDRLEIRRSLGFMPQEPRFDPRARCSAFVNYVAVLKELVDRRQRSDEVRRVLAATELSEVANRRIRSLSGGMQRRVSLAQALLGNPKLLLLDEPTVGLDPEQRLRVRSMLSDLAERRGILLSTHLIEDVAALCHRVIVLHEGQVRFAGTPNELVNEARGRVWASDEPASDATLSWRAADGRYRHLGVMPSSADPLEPTLEDGYLMLVRSNGAAH
jgi:ABC-2 type transport system ATP-binding protein